MRKAKTLHTGDKNILSESEVSVHFLNHLRLSIILISYGPWGGGGFHPWSL